MVDWLETPGGHRVIGLGNSIWTNMVYVFLDIFSQHCTVESMMHCFNILRLPTHGRSYLKQSCQFVLFHSNLSWLGGGCKYFLFSPRSLGWSNLTIAYFSDGWFNHQPFMTRLRCRGNLNLILIIALSQVGPKLVWEGLLGGLGTGKDDMIWLNHAQGLWRTWAKSQKNWEDVYWQQNFRLNFFTLSICKWWPFFWVVFFPAMCWFVVGILPRVVTLWQYQNSGEPQILMVFFHTWRSIFLPQVPSKPWYCCNLPWYEKMLL